MFRKVRGPAYLKLLKSECYAAGLSSSNFGLLGSAEVIQLTTTNNDMIVLSAVACGKSSLTSNR